jgi:hypothetical protein
MEIVGGAEALGADGDSSTGIRLLDQVEAEAFASITPTGERS